MAQVGVAAADEAEAQALLGLKTLMWSLEKTLEGAVEAEEEVAVEVGAALVSPVLVSQIRLPLRIPRLVGRYEVVDVDVAEVAVAVAAGCRVSLCLIQLPQIQCKIGYVSFLMYINKADQVPSQNNLLKTWSLQQAVPNSGFEGSAFPCKSP